MNRVRKSQALSALNSSRPSSSWFWWPLGIAAVGSTLMYLEWKRKWV